MVIKAGIPEAIAPDADLDAIGAAWAKAVRAHRRLSGAFGKVGFVVITNPTGDELHLTEETTFRPAGKGCPLMIALAWVQTQAARRADAGSGGKFLVESEDKAGRVTFARVVETTVIRRSGLDT